MGFLAKAASLREEKAPHGGDSPALAVLEREDARDTALAPAHGVGLLRRSEILAQLPEIEAPPGHRHEPAQPSIRESIPECGSPLAREKLAAAAATLRSVVAGIEAPAVIFAGLRRDLALERAAILVPDPSRGVFSPWSAVGFDRTSLRRLRLAEPEASSLTLSILSGKALAGSLRLFSSRDASTIEHLHIWPCVRDDSTVAVILAAEMEVELDRSAELRSSLAEILGSAALLLWERRESVLARLRPAQARHVAASPEQVVAEALDRAAATKGRALVFRVGLHPIQEALMALAPAVDPFRLTQDVGTVLRYFLRDLGELTIAPSPDSLLVVVQGAQKPDAELWVHTLVGALAPYFPSISGVRAESLPVQSRRFPEDGATAAELISGLT